jgi:tRNA-2-methylthio-N6-dimethylallyladenosine synthase
VRNATTAFRQISALKAVKARRPEMIVAECGCMMQQDDVCECIYENKYPYVDIVFGTL